MEVGLKEKLETEKPLWRAVRQRVVPTPRQWQLRWNGLDMAVCSGHVALEKGVWVVVSQ